MDTTEQTTALPRAGLLEKVAQFYRKSLAGAQQAQTWLKRHQIDEDTLAHFQTGYLH
jgi:hypothetical protein